MSNDLAKRHFNTRERLTSTDLVRVRDIASRNMQQALAAVVVPDADKSGVISGLLVTIDAVNRTATVGVGLGLLVDLAQVFPDSQYRWIEAQDPITVQISIGTGYDRWDIVEIEPGILVTSTEIVDVWDPTIPPFGSFVPQSLTKEEISQPVITIRQGVENPGLPPFFPVGFAGRIPLAFVKVAADGTVSAVTAGTVRCRPLIRPPGGLDQGNALDTPRDNNSSPWAQGGGIAVDSDDATDIEVRPCNGQFGVAAMGFAVTGGTEVDMSDANIWEDGATGKPGSDAIGYVYAIPPPYIETGYPTLAGREFVPGNDVIGEFATVFKTVISGSIQQENCLIVISTDGPNTLYINGGPFGTANIRDVPFTQGAATPATSARQEWVYLGAFDQDGSVAKKQIYFPGGTVVPLQRVPLTDFKTNGSLGPHNVRTPTSGGANPFNLGELPLTAKRVAFTVKARLVTVLAFEIQIEIRDETYSGWDTPAEARPQQVSLVRGDGNASAIEIIPQVEVILPINGQVEIDLNTSLASMNELDMRPSSYIDEILSNR